MANLKIEIEDKRYILNKTWLKVFKYPLASCVVQEYPNCIGCSIITSFSVNEKYRGKGYSKIFLSMIVEDLFKKDINCIQMTVRSDNELMIKAAISSGFKMINKFFNSKTGNEVCFFAINRITNDKKCNTGQ